MAEPIQQQKLDVEVDFYDFALQDLDGTQVPLEYPQGREAGDAFLPRGCGWVRLMVVVLGWVGYAWSGSGWGVLFGVVSGGV
ncbi:hypothetical protein ACFVW1_35935, partial [Streptomyces olivochromogenes]|uniref:hypothetical protein n=1 Tax=Streptomyces olivochromogenes TaxID=1963 RepID=UPI0036DAA8A8